MIGNTTTPAVYRWGNQGTERAEHAQTILLVSDDTWTLYRLRRNLINLPGRPYHSLHSNQKGALPLTPTHMWINRLSMDENLVYPTTATVILPVMWLESKWNFIICKLGVVSVPAIWLNDISGNCSAQDTYLEYGKAPLPLVIRHPTPCHPPKWIWEYVTQSKHVYIYKWSHSFFYHNILSI